MKQYYDIRTYKQYDRDVKLAVRRGLDMQQLLTVVDMLRKDEPLPPKYRNHLLSGDSLFVTMSLSPCNYGTFTL